ncbi:MAG: hypothetical protein WC819_00460 [Parcubacteria group bacterium]|jgi:hypothetical protein
MSIDDFFVQQILFISVTLGLLIVPGWLFLRAFFARNQFALLEKFVLSVPIGFALITLSVIGIDHFNISLTPAHLLTLFASIIVPLLIASLFLHRKTTQTHTDIFTFSHTQTFVIAFLIFFMICIKSIFLINAIFPTATDLGHHLYWVEKIAVDKSLPDYQKIEIDTSSDPAQLTAPHKIADFIVGEHIFLGVIAILTHLSVISTFPSLFLLVINIFTALMMFVLVRRVCKKHPRGALIAIVTLLVIGPLWAISGAQAKFVSGGVIGNLLGNLLIPAIIYFFYRAFTEKRALLLVPAVILTTALAYTHHLSTLIFGYVFIFSLLTFIILQRNRWSDYTKIFGLLKNYYIIPLIIIAATMLFVIAPPAYLDSSVIADSVGAPSKSSRTGTPFADLLAMTGEARFVFGVIGLFLLTAIAGRKYLFSAKVRHDAVRINIFGCAFFIGWGASILLMSLAPQTLYINIISSRIATYNIFPLAILTAFAVTWLFDRLINKDSLAVPQWMLSATCLLILTFICTTGLRDNATSMNNAPQTNDALQTFHAGEYASTVFKSKLVQNDFWMIKDHNYITADTWLKIFFAYDYSYPLSRALLARYETNPDRETCTLDMITAPDSSTAVQCYDNLHIGAVLVSTEQDAGQFLHNDQFSRIYQNDKLSLFIRKQ